MASKTDQQHVAVCGHSFIKRLRDLANIHHKMDTNFKIDLITQGGWTWDNFTQSPYRLQALLTPPHPTIVYLELGTNDLDRNLSAFEVADAAVLTAHKLLQSDIKIVIIGLVLFKEKTRNIPVQTFNKKMEEYNTYMYNIMTHPHATRRLITQFTNPRLWFWNHLRMYGSETPLLQHDGTHLKDENGNQRLYGSIHHAILQALGSI